MRPSSGESNSNNCIHGYGHFEHLLNLHPVKHRINTNKTKATFSRLIRLPGMQTEWDYSGRMGWMKSKKIDEA